MDVLLESKNSISIRLVKVTLFVVSVLAWPDLIFAFMEHKRRTHLIKILSGKVSVSFLSSFTYFSVKMKILRKRIEEENGKPIKPPQQQAYKNTTHHHASHHVINIGKEQSVFSSFSKSQHALDCMHVLAMKPHLIILHGWWVCVYSIKYKKAKEVIN